MSVAGGLLNPRAPHRLILDAEPTPADVPGPIFADATKLDLDRILEVVRSMRPAGFPRAGVDDASNIPTYSLLHADLNQLDPALKAKMGRNLLSGR